MAEELTAPWERAQLEKQKYQEQEKRTAKNQGGRQQPNSGRLWHSRGDVILDNPIAKLLIDNKGTEAASFRIDKDDWKKLKRNSNRTPPGCLPGLQVDIQEISLMVFDLSFYDELVRYINYLEMELKNARDETA